MKTSEAIQFPEPPLARFLFGDTRMSWVWFVLRLYVGYEWITAGWEKVTSSTWVGSQAGVALSGFLEGAIQKVGGANPAVSGWYGSFLADFVLPRVAIFAYIVSYGELLVGIALILGVFTGIAAFCGAFMNLNYLFAGAVSINPLLLLIELFLILAWRNAGWLGLDQWFLPYIGVPWKPGKSLN